MVKLGSNVSMKGKKMLLGASEEAAKDGSNTLMIYTGAPQNTRRRPIEEMNIEAGYEHMNENNISDIIVNAPYIINIANTTKPATFEIGTSFLKSEIHISEDLGSKQIVLHTVAHVGCGAEKVINRK